MSVLIWNLRGIGNPQSLQYLKILIHQHKPVILAILEPKQDGNKVSSIARKMGFPNCYHGNPDNPYIWLFWSSAVEVSIQSITSQSVTIDMAIRNSFAGTMTFVYARCTSIERVELWDHLVNISQAVQSPGMLGGDFNTILSLEEKRGGNSLNNQGMQDFNEFLIEASLSDAGFEGNLYTWSNNKKGRHRIWQRLDRILINGEALASPIEAKVKHLARIASDHAPLLIQFSTIVKKRSRFIFQRMWTDHDEFQQVVHDAWQFHSLGRAGHQFTANLGATRQILQQWNWSKFGNVQNNISTLQQSINNMEAQLQDNWNDAIYDQCQKAREDLHKNIQWDNELLQQKTRIKWMEEGHG